MRAIFLSLFSCLAISVSGSAQATDIPLDPTFGDAGRARLFVGWMGGGTIRAVTAAPGGGYFVIGTGNGDAAAIRLTGQGEIDTSWGREGRLDVPVAADLFSAAPGPTGTTYMSGAMSGTGGILRVGAGGQLDKQFASNGVWKDSSSSIYLVSTDIGGVFGVAQRPGNLPLRAVKLGVNGSADATFGGPRDVVIPGFTGEKTVKSVHAAGDGRLLVVLNHTGSGSGASSSLLIMIGPNGELDTTSFAQGVLHYANQIVVSSDVLPSGNLLITQCIDPCDESSPRFLRQFSRDGLPVVSYGNLGALQIPALAANHLLPVATHVDSEGRTIVQAIVNQQPRRIARIRLTNTGSIDTTFAANGYAYVTDYVNSGVHLPLPSERVRISIGEKLFEREVTKVVRHLESGELDFAFGASGHAELRFTRPIAKVVGLARDIQDRYIAVGSTWNGASQGFVSRLLPGGAQDTTFGTFGTRFLDRLPIAIEVLNDGKLLVATESSLTRFDEAGSVDSTFGVAGIVDLGSAVSLRALMVDRKQRIVVAGGSRLTVPIQTTYATRFLSNGETDAAFDDTYLTGAPGSINRIALDGDGYYFAGYWGGSFVFGGNYALVKRTLENGSPDISFGGTSQLPSGTVLPAGSMYLPEIGLRPVTLFSVDQSGRWLAGNASSNALHRYTRSGNLDNGFGSNGSVGVAGPSAVALLPDKRLVISSGQRPSSPYAEVTQSLVVASQDAVGGLRVSRPGTTTSVFPYHQVEPWAGIAASANGKVVFGGTHGIDAVVARADVGASRCALDVDGDSRIEPLTDGKLIAVVLSRSALDASAAVSGNSAATRWKRIDVVDSVNAMLGTGALDLDGDGEVRLESDILALLRIMFGFKGDAVVQGAVEPTKPRATYGGIQAHLSTTCDYL